MGWFTAEDYEFARQVLQRGIATIYLIAFLSTAAQFRALLGEHGLVPVPALLARPRAIRGPTIFRWHYSDRLLLAVVWVGAGLSAALVAGLPQAGFAWLPLAAFLAIWLLYMSVVNVGQVFYGFGWETLLLEAGFLAAFLGSDAALPPTTIILLTVWLVFRLEFGAGMIKMRGDRVWRDLTALYYHHETQPMPNPLSRFAHHLPKPIHRLEVLGNHFAQLVVPFLLFAPQPIASVAAAIAILTQLWLIVTGNFAWLNLLTVILAFSAISDTVVHFVLPFVPAALGAHAATPIWFLVLVLAVTVLLVVLSFWPIRNLLSRSQMMNVSFNRWHLVNAYGAFGSVTRDRYEVIVEGTDDAVPGERTQWHEYEFKGKPGDVNRIPRQFAPYHLRLDWLMWFLPLGGGPDRWFMVFLMRLLTADHRTLRLLRTDPFHGTQPRWVRARLFHYRFSTRSERRESSAWWVREPAGDFVPPVSLPRPQ